MMAKMQKIRYQESENKSSAYKSRTGPPWYMVIVKLDGSEPDEVVVDEGIIYDRTDHIPINVDSIPSYVCDDLAKATLQAVRRFLRQSGSHEILAAEKEKLLREGSKLLR